MTCKEFRDLVKDKAPEDATIGEVMAYITHKRTCRKCNKWVLDGQIPISEDRASAFMDKAAHCVSDPEFVVPEPPKGYKTK